MPYSRYMKIQLRTKRKLKIYGKVSGCLREEGGWLREKNQDCCPTNVHIH